MENELTGTTNSSYFCIVHAWMLAISNILFPGIGLNYDIWNLLNDMPILVALETGLQQHDVALQFQFSEAPLSGRNALALLN